MGLLQIIHDALAKGAVEKGWGGDECRKAVPISTHITESFGWLFVAFWFYSKVQGRKWYENLKSTISKELVEYDKANPKGNPLRWLEILIGSLHVLMFLQLIYFKSTISALIYLLQPCHQILLFQGIALLNNGTLGVLISLFVLPALTGTTLAMLFPETGGLDQFLEMEAYWLQHYLIEIVPIYLLLRKNGLALKLCSMKTVMAGLWILVLVHFALLESVDLTFNVNVDFILCPTDAMVAIFAMFPQWMFLPSYRTFMTLAVLLVGTIISYIYIGIATLIQKTFMSSKKEKVK